MCYLESISGFGSAGRDLKTLDFVQLFGGQGQNRTADTKIFSLLLYLLSYLPTDSAGGTATVF